MRFGAPGPLFTPLLTLQLKPLLGIDPHTLSPAQAIRRVSQPILLINGANDRHATPAEARALFAAANEPKELWIVDKASHVDLHHFAGEEYEARVGRFLDEALGDR